MRGRCTGPRLEPVKLPRLHDAPAPVPDPAPAPAPAAPAPLAKSAPAGPVGVPERAPDGTDLEPPTFAPPPASPWADGFGRTAIRCAQGLLVFAVAALLVYGYGVLRVVVIPVLIATLIAAALSPLVHRLERMGLPRLLGTWVTLLGGLALFGGAGWLVVAAVRGQWDELSASAEQGFGQVRDLVLDGPLPITAEQIEQARSAGVDLLTGERFRTGALAGVSAVAEVVTGLLLGFVILFFLLNDGARIWQFFLRPFSGAKRERMELVGQRSTNVLGGYVRGTAMVALVDAVFIGIGLAVIGVPLVLPLALITFITAFIPVVGALLAGVIAALVALVANGPIAALLVIGVVLVVNQVEGNVLQPMLMGKALSLHPLAILLALTAGTILAGIIGAILAVPIAAVAWTAARTWSEEKRTSTAALTRPLPPAEGAAA